jgi:hypothetical protein
MRCAVTGSAAVLVLVWSYFRGAIECEGEVVGSWLVPDFWISGFGGAESLGSVGFFSRNFLVYFSDFLVLE